MPTPETQPPKPLHLLLLQQLTERDQERISAFLSIANHRLRGDWRPVSDGHGDVVITAAEWAPTVQPALDEPSATLTVVDPSSSLEPSPSTLVRPIQYEALIEALEGVERRWLGADAPEPPPAPARPPQPSASWPAPARSAPVSAPPPAAAPRPAPSAARSTAGGGFELPDGARFRLGRWPPSGLLGRHRYNVRIATFLTSRSLELDELVRLSNVQREDCESFLRELGKAGLLECEAPTQAGVPAQPAQAVAQGPAAPVPAATTAAPAPAFIAPAPAPAATRVPRPSLSLLGRIRRTFGLSS